MNYKSFSQAAKSTSCNSSRLNAPLKVNRLLLQMSQCLFTTFFISSFIVVQALGQTPAPATPTQVSLRSSDPAGDGYTEDPTSQLLANTLVAGLLTPSYVMAKEASGTITVPGFISNRDGSLRATQTEVTVGPTPEIVEQFEGTQGLYLRANRKIITLPSENAQQINGTSESGEPSTSEAHVQRRTSRMKTYGIIVRFMVASSVFSAGHLVGVAQTWHTTVFNLILTNFSTAAPALFLGGIVGAMSAYLYSATVGWFGAFIEYKDLSGFLLRRPGGDGESVFKFSKFVDFMKKHPRIAKTLGFDKYEHPMPDGSNQKLVKTLGVEFAFTSVIVLASTILGLGAYPQDIVRDSVSFLTSMGNWPTMLSTTIGMVLIWGVDILRGSILATFAQGYADTALNAMVQAKLHYFKNHPNMRLAAENQYYLLGILPSGFQLLLQAIGMQNIVNDGVEWSLYTAMTLAGMTFYYYVKNKYTLGMQELTPLAASTKPSSCLYLGK